ncbi:hypothetical protein PANDA_012405 [Ailuropoda melanoleuca]|uniref:Uncharacterized protein n=1 Tax=Ailuropoda melanoleuca TaxID=9646 RepID=D2HLL9_AILME|nr:hypothetical protein PANDA_012405 [Ailuropoda melanoleuca]
MTKEKPLPKKFLLSKRDFEGIAPGSLKKNQSSHKSRLTGKTSLQCEEQPRSKRCKRAAQIQYLQQAQQPSAAQLRSTVVDPVINWLVPKKERLRNAEARQLRHSVIQTKRAKDCFLIHIHVLHAIKWQSHPKSSLWKVVHRKEEEDEEEEEEDDEEEEEEKEEEGKGEEEEGNA